ncbi:MAG: hypothetical protein K0R31_2166 [Clostridiales bacterium]|jgi:reverse gyrase|nr:hypothetical protein [Clostridiales bacterium]
MQIVVTVEKDCVIKANKYLEVCLNQANQADVNSTFVTIDDAKQALNEAKGIYRTLDCLGLLSDGNHAGDDISRITEKLMIAMEEKRRKLWRK